MKIYYGISNEKTDCLFDFNAKETFEEKDFEKEVIIKERLSQLDVETFSNVLFLINHFKLVLSQ